MKNITNKAPILLIVCALFSCSLGGPKPCFELNCETLRQMDKILAGEEVLLSNCTDDGMAFTWDFGDGTTSTLKSPRHTWEEPGDYIISLTAESEKSSKTKEMDVTISPSLYGSWKGSGDYDGNDLPIAFNFTQVASKIKGEFIYGSGYADGVVSSNSTIEGTDINIICSYVSVMFFQGEEFTFSNLFTFTGTVNDALDTIEGTEFIIHGNSQFGQPDRTYGAWKITKQ